MTTAKITYLDGFRLHRGLVAGIRRVLDRQRHLNRINVFPVPDGDTGTNLSYTLLSIVDNSGARIQAHAGETAVAIADAALDGARGNSGVILAQFLQGFSDSCVSVRRLTVSQFSKAMSTGYEYAHQALSEPVEGTILSVIRAAVDTCREKTREGANDFLQLLKDVHLRAEEALRRTPEQLEILRKKGVVDAGGQGFVYILKGMFEFVHRGSLRDQDLEIEAEVIVPSPELPDPIRQPAGEDLNFRYCTECMITGAGILRNKLREALLGLGNSMVLGGSKERLRLHIHTNAPRQVFETAGAFGIVTGEKVDDMRRQVAIASQTAGRVAVVTDSTADIPQDLIETLDIYIVPARLSFGAKGYLDKVTITPDEFYNELATNPDHPTTSQPSPGDFWRLYQFLSEHYGSIVSLHLPRPVSGTLQSAENAIRRLPDTTITVLDGMNTTVGLGLIVTAAASVARRGGSHAQVVATAQKAIQETKIFAAIADLSYAVRGGRVSASRKRIADLLRAKPVLSVTPRGTVDMAGVFFGRRDLAGGLARWTARRIDRQCTYNCFISHAKCPEAATRLKELLPEMGYSIRDCHITQTGAALGAHAGPGSLILALQPADLA